MSESTGLHVALTADSGNFTQTMQNATARLAELAVREKELRSAIQAAEQNLKKQGTEFGKDSEQAKKARKALTDLCKQEISLKSDVKAATDDINRQTKAYAQNAEEAKGAMNATDKLASGIRILKGIALGYAGKTLFSALIGSNAEFEQSLTAFEVMLGSAEKADRMMEQLTDFAAVTPLKLDDVKEGTQLLLSYGVAEEDIMKRLQQLGDVSQGNAEKFGRVALAYGQMVAKQKVTGEELRQMTEAGVPLMNGLAESMGVTTAELSKMIEKGNVGIPELNKALESMTSEGGKFFGMMDKQSKTMEGLWSTLTDNAEIFAREVGEKSFSYLKSELSDLMSTVNEMEESGELSAVADEIGSSISNTVVFIGNFIKFLWEMRDVLEFCIKSVLTYKAAVLGLSVIQNIVNISRTWITTLKTLQALKAAGITLTKLHSAAIVKDTAAQAACNAAGIKDIAVKNGQIVATEEATGATLSLNAALMANPIGLVVAAIGLLVGGLVMLYGSYHETTEEINVMSEALEKNRTEIEKSTAAYEKNKAAIEDKLKEQLSEIEVVKIYASELEELSAKENKSAQDKEKMEKLVKGLNSAIPNLNLSIDKTTGALNMETSAVWKAVEAWDAYIRLTAMKEIAVEAQKRQYNAKVNLENATQKKQIVDNGVNAGNSYLEKVKNGEIVDNSVFGGGSFYKNMELAKENQKKAIHNQTEANKELTAANNEVYRINEEIAALTLKVGDYDFTKDNTPTTPGSTTTKGGGSKTQKSTAASDYKNYIKQIEEEDERWNSKALELGYYTQTLEDGTMKKIAYTEDAFIWSIKNRANRYRGYIDEVRALNTLTEEEKADIIREYAQKAEDLDLEAYKKQKALYKEAYDERHENSTDWIQQKKEEGNYDDAIEGLKRVKQYTEEYYNLGVFSAKEYWQLVQKINKEIDETNVEKFEAALSDSKDYISKTNKYDEWAENGDNEVAAWQRVYAAIKKAYDEGVIDWYKYIELVDETTESIRDAAKTDMEARISEEGEFLKKKYEEQYNAEKNALEEKLELTKEYAEKEKQEIRDRAQAEIDAIDKLIEARKRAKEDEDDNLKMQRLKNKLEYEMDADNRIALEKEIKKLQEDIDDKLFSREMADKKAAINAKMDLDISNTEAFYNQRIADLELDIKNAEDKYNEQTDGAHLAQQIYKNLGLSDFEKLVAETGDKLGANWSAMANQALKIMHDNLNALAGISSAKQYYNYNTTNETNFAPTYNISGDGLSMSPSELRRRAERDFKIMKHLGKLQ